MKKLYSAPSASVELFMANDYVAACWGVGCDCSAANSLEKNMPNTKPGDRNRNNYDGGQTHSASACGQLSSQHVAAGDSGIATGMYEDSSDQGKLSCTVYTDSSYSTAQAYASINIGDYIYWTTVASNGRVWHHMGTVTETVHGHPNRS